MPAGNWATKAGGRRFLSSFWRIVAEMAMPHVWQGVCEWKWTDI